MAMKPLNYMGYAAAHSTAQAMAQAPHMDQGAKDSGHHRKRD